MPAECDPDRLRYAPGGGAFDGGRMTADPGALLLGLAERSLRPLGDGQAGGQHRAGRDRVDRDTTVSAPCGRNVRRGATLTAPGPP